MKKRLENKPVIMSAPCRLDFGGTLDLSTFYYPLMKLSPSTFNIAIDMRTTISLTPNTTGKVKISSTGFETAEYNHDKLPYSHPMGLMFAIAAYFGANSIHIDIQSTSPPRSALGGSSVAAVALIAAFMSLTERFSNDAVLPKDEIVLLAHSLESCVARVSCGIQDQLAAAYGGVNKWAWTGDVLSPPYKKTELVGEDSYGELQESFIAAYCGNPHESKDINGRWVEEFLSGRNTAIWEKIVGLSNKFSDAVKEKDYHAASELMKEETKLRLKMTPDVLDTVGHELYNDALKNNCGARFTGAGGGGCIWAIGEKDKIADLKSDWEKSFSKNNNGFLLDVVIDSDGVRKE